jgi:hypothetical protein
MIFYDKPTNSIYYTTNRLGSSLLHDISLRGEFTIIGPCDVPEIASADRKNTKIFFPFREPHARFKSGLTVHLFNRTNHTKQLPPYAASKEVVTANDNSLEIYKYMLQTIDNTATDNCHLGSVAGKRPYHLYDLHTDHWLYVPLTYMVYNYNVQLLPLYDLSSHLRHRFPHCDDLIKKRERPTSFNQTHPIYEPIWQVYKSVFIDNVPLNYEHVQNENSTDWYQWMAPEIEIFQNFVKYLKHDNIAFIGHKLVNKLMDGNVYFSDPFSPLSFNLMQILKSLHGHNPLNYKFDYFLQSMKFVNLGLDSGPFQVHRPHLVG